jgi:hypothetical protein
MQADKLLQSLGMHLGVPDLHFNADGCARLGIDGAPALDFELDETGAIQMYSVLGPLPTEGRTSLYAQMLQGNLFGSSTAGAALAIDDLHGEVVLCRTVTTKHVSVSEFTAKVESFVAAAEDWQGRLVSVPAQEPAGRLVSAPMMDHFLRA